MTDPVLAFVYIAAGAASTGLYLKAKKTDDSGDMSLAIIVGAITGISTLTWSGPYIAISIVEVAIGASVVSLYNSRKEKK
jgi:asparagine N-glycosylation enzyme membrane subunit Stt3